MRDLFVGLSAVSFFLVTSAQCAPTNSVPPTDNIGAGIGNYGTATPAIPKPPIRQPVVFVAHRAIVLDCNKGHGVTAMELPSGKLMPRPVMAIKTNMQGKTCMFTPMPDGQPSIKFLRVHGGYAARPSWQLPNPRILPTIALKPGESIAMLVHSRNATGGVRVRYNPERLYRGGYELDPRVKEQLNYLLNQWLLSRGYFQV